MDCLPQDQSLSDDNEYMMVNSNEEDDNGIARADRRAQEVIDCAAVDLVTAAIQLDENGNNNADNDEDNMAIKHSNSVELPQEDNLLDKMISNNSPVPGHVMLTNTSLIRKKINDDPTGMEVINLTSTSCAKMQMKKVGAMFFWPWLQVQATKQFQWIARSG